MDKAEGKWRDIKFKSEKNHAVLTVHSREAREYARILENDLTVESYEVCKKLNIEKYAYVPITEIRKDYFLQEWSSDFLIRFVDGSIGIREIIKDGEITKKSVQEKLEFSRRYWKENGIENWKIIFMTKERGTDVL